MTKTKPQPKQANGKTITFRASTSEVRIIHDGLRRYGLRKASDVLRMALKKFKEGMGQ